MHNVKVSKAKVLKLNSTARYYINNTLELFLQKLIGNHSAVTLLHCS